MNSRFDTGVSSPSSGACGSHQPFENSMNPISTVCIFSVILLIPLAMGAFFCWKRRKNETMLGYFFGGKQMHPVSYHFLS